MYMRTQFMKRNTIVECKMGIQDKNKKQKTKSKFTRTVLLKNYIYYKNKKINKYEIGLSMNKIVIALLSICLISHADTNYSFQKRLRK